MAHYTGAMFQSLVDTPSGYITRCYRIEKRDGTFIRITDHDTSLEVTEGMFEGTDPAGGWGIYTPIGSGLQGSAVRQEAALKVSNVELAGAITSELISEDDLHEGKYEGAIVFISWVDTRVPWAGALRISKFTLTDFNWDGQKFTAQSSNVAERLGRKIGKTYSKACSHAFMDAGCGVAQTIDKTKWVNARVDNDVDGTASTNSKIHLGFASAPWAAVNKPADYFKAGAIKWLTGKNAGAMYPIRKSTPRVLTDDSHAQGLIRMMYPRQGDECTIIDANGFSWRFFWTENQSGNYPTGTPFSNGTYCNTHDPATGAYWVNTGDYANQLAFAINSAASSQLKVTAVQMNATDHDYADLPTNHPEYSAGGGTTLITRNVLLTQDIIGTSGNTDMVTNDATNVGVYNFGENGMDDGATGSGDQTHKAVLHLQYPTKADVAQNDTFELYAGCDKTWTTCTSTTLAGEINNRAKFGGFPYIPGTQQIAKIGDKEV